MRRGIQSITIVAALAVLCMSMAAMGQPAPAVPGGPAAKIDGKGQVILSWDEFVKITGYDPAQKKGDTMLTVPWDEVEKLLGVKVENVNKQTQVDLPWKDFKALLEWSVTKKGEKPETPPPTDFIIGLTSYTGNLTADNAEFTLKMKIDVLRKTGWKRIPVLPTSVAITECTLGEGAFLNTANNMYEILTEKPGTLEVTLKFSVAVQTGGGINRVTFPRVQAGSSVLDLTVAPGAGETKVGPLDVKVVGAQSQLVKAAADGKTAVAAAIPGGQAVEITWERALPKVEAAPTKMYADTRVLVAVAEGVLLCQEMVNYNVLHTPVRELKLTVPAGVSILEVIGPNLVDWRVNNQNELAVVMRNDVIGAYALRLSYEKTVADAVEVPVIRPTGVEREKGQIAVVAMANVEISPGAVEGANAIDVRALPADILSMSNQPTLLAFRYVADKFRIPLTIKKHGEITVLLTIVDNGLFTAMQLADGRRMTKVVYAVRNNRNQFLRVKMPAGSEIWSASVSGNPVAPAKDEKGNVLIPLVRSSTGAKELASFPVELVYVETPDKAPPAAGKLHVTLPTLDSPAMHVMFNYYLPAEGEYTVSEGLFGSKSGFSGTMRLVADFTALQAGPGAEVVRRDMAKQVENMQTQIDQRMDVQAKATGVTPIRVQLPVQGRLFKLERILALPGDELYFEVQYKGWKPTQ